MTKTILYGAIAAVVAVLVGASTFANAASPHEEDSQLFGLIMELETQIISLQTQLQQLQLLPGPPGPQGDPGPQGIQGPKGDDGADGTTSTYQKYAHHGGLNPAGDQMTMNCDPGDFVTGAAAGPLGGTITSERPEPLNSNPNARPPATGWTFGTSGTSGMDMWIVCMDVP